MTISLAVDIADGMAQPESEMQYLEAWQFLVDTGLVWQMQGWFGRTAVAMIENGYINKPKDDSKELFTPRGFLRGS